MRLMLYIGLSLLLTVQYADACNVEASFEKSELIEAICTEQTAPRKLRKVTQTRAAFFVQPITMRPLPVSIGPAVKLSIASKEPPYLVFRSLLI